MKRYPGLRQWQRAYGVGPLPGHILHVELLGRFICKFLGLFWEPWALGSLCPHPPLPQAFWSCGSHTFAGHWSEQACSNTDWQPHPRNFWFKSPGVAPDLHNQQVPNLMLLVCRIDCCPRGNSFLASWPEQTISVFLKGLGASQRKGSFFFFFQILNKESRKRSNRGLLEEIMAGLSLLGLLGTRLPGSLPQVPALAPASRNSGPHDQCLSKTMVPSRTEHHPGCAVWYSS